MNKLLLCSIMFGLSISARAVESSELFTLEQLPVGKSVTLPKPATTSMAGTNSVKLTSTDLPQTVKLTAYSTHNAPVPPFKVAIYDPFQDRVQYVEINGKTPVLYNFHALGTINIVPKLGKAFSSAVRLRVESDKPMEISR